MALSLQPSCKPDSSSASGNRFLPVSEGYAGSSVNATIFRRNSVSSWNDKQVVAYYDSTARVVLACRNYGDSTWGIHTTQYSGDVRDAHNGISIMHDGKGFLHMAWDHHGDSLNYCKSSAPGSLQMEKPQAMCGMLENNVTYPEFYRIPGGDLLFLYRDGSSGNGNLVMNHYDLERGSWSRLHDRLIDGEGERNAYWQLCISKRGTIHLSWVWRETWDAASNHDVCYARSVDGGRSWESSEGEEYTLPIQAGTAEYAMKIPQNCNLINQTSMVADASDRPYIATYFRDTGDSCTQFKILYRRADGWAISTVSDRVADFTLGGGGTRSLTLSRPQLLFDGRDGEGHLHMIFRDREYGDRVCMASAKIEEEMKWEIEVLSQFPVGAWEPSYDTERWRQSRSLNLFIQDVRQGDNEGIIRNPATTVGILEVVVK